MMAPAQPGDAVLVRWVDAITDAGWVNRKEAQKHPQNCMTVGVLIHTDPRSIAIALSFGGEEVNGTVSIPATWVSSVRVLKRGVWPNANK